jgi:hypothetical protein
MRTFITSRYDRIISVPEPCMIIALFRIELIYSKFFSLKNHVLRFRPLVQKIPINLKFFS